MGCLSTTQNARPPQIIPKLGTFIVCIKLSNHNNFGVTYCMASEIQGAKVVTFVQNFVYLLLQSVPYLWNRLLLSQYKYTTLEHFNAL